MDNAVDGPPLQEIWRSPSEMNALETLFWRSENHPGMRSNILGVLVLDRSPDWDRLVARHEWASRIVPRLRHRVVEPPLRLGRPFWTDDAAFAIRNHLLRIRLPEPGTTRQLLDLAQSISSTPFSPDRPLWSATLVEGLADGGAAYLLKLHHSISDGIGAAQLLGVLADFTPGTPADRLLPPLQPRTRPASGAVLLAGRLGRQAARLPSVAGHAAGRLRKARWPQAPQRRAPSIRRLLHAADSFARTMLLPPVPASPLLQERSRSAHFDALEFPLTELKVAGKAAGGSLNDTFVAGLAGGFQRYHHKFGLRLAAVPLVIPISVRHQHDLPAGNRLASTRLGISLENLGPAERIAEVRDRVATMRTGPVLRGLDLLSRPITPLPGPVVRSVFAEMFRGNDLMATNFPGVPIQGYLAGAEVVAVTPFAPLLRGAASVALVTYLDTCHLGLTLDTGAFTAPDTFVACVRESFEEILALADRNPANPQVTQAS
ncbi:hypothetical protein BS329_41430 [Amycolatopsis coloradensis]|uniref:diacylglycerol O-acyltransferase n=1 Tax=Amycolatopsis coloradensis TaxID=76021 RepID=A0A1R0KD61_9PSEU|nr:wax ester/triacylglycerol synthase domain-containing protein [Amycolatopsis coloradensis]OLZ42814.1 hypothetical protein BS329_41430 [Amycolatopsis coloradensis]